MNTMINFKKRFSYIMLMILLQSAMSLSKAADGIILLDNQMPAKNVSAIATQSVVLKPGFNAVGTNGTFHAKIGTINSVYPLITVGTGSSPLRAPKTTETTPTSKNRVVTTVPLTGVTVESQLNTGNSRITMEYSDGLGRPNMTVRKGSAGKNDLVSVVNYDGYGQVSNQWMPTPVDATTIAEPGMAMQQALNFYKDDMPYSTMSQPTTDAAGHQSIQRCNPGEAWHNGNKVKSQTIMGSDLSNPLLTIRQYGVVGDALVLQNDRFQGFGADVVQTTDEDGHTAYTFTDTFGRTLLQRAVNNGIYHDTYYVYDDMGQLRFVLSPEASDKLGTTGSTYSFGTNFSTDSSPLALYAYAYKYNEKGLCIAKKLPGKDWTKMMYDQVGHLVFSQDGNQRTSSQWTFYKYDVMSRLIQSGTTTITDANTMQTTYNSTTSKETYGTTGYSSDSPVGTNTVVLTQNFYDSYDFITVLAKPSLAFDANVTGFDAKYSKLLDGVDLGIATQGKLTGTSVAMLDNSVNLVTAMYYDKKGRVVQTRANNHLGGYDYEFFHYNFTGQVLNKRHVHNTPFITSPITENYSLGYDAASRLISVRHALNTQKDILMDSLVYDEIGRVSKKILHGGIQNINYTYNIHNSIKSIGSEKFNETLYYQDSPYGNACYNGNISAKTFGPGLDQFYCFSYDQLNRLKGGGNGSWQSFTEEVGGYDKNGNISGIKRNGVVYNNSNMVQGPIDDLTLTYNGNQLKKTSDGVDQSKVLTTNDFEDKQDATLPDDAEYKYDANGNQTADLNKGIALIRYNVLNLPQKVQFQNGTKNEYLYDASGVKHRAGYNYSTATSLIPLGNTDPTKENNAPSTFQTDYCGNYVYEKSTANGNPVLQRIITPEGYITSLGIPSAYVSNWRAVYCLKDYQGNTRVTLTSDILANNTSKVFSASDQIDYYPFGMERSNSCRTNGGPFNSGSTPYLYSNKEIDRMNGLNEYDFSARWQDAAVPGFTTMDPLAENHYNESPYLYCGNNPVNRTDPTGLDWYQGGRDNGYYFNSAQTAHYLYTYGGDRFTNVGKSCGYVDSRGHFMYGDFSGNWHDEGPASFHDGVSTTAKDLKPQTTSYFFGFMTNTTSYAEERDGGGGKIGKDQSSRFNTQLSNTRSYFSGIGKGIDNMISDPTLAFMAKNAFFAMKVKTGAEYDIKLTSFSERKIGGITAGFEGTQFAPDDFGNYNYGVAAKAMGFSLNWAEFGAGMSSIFLQGNIDWSNPGGFFDPKNDTKMIEIGYNRYK